MNLGYAQTVPRQTNFATPCAPRLLDQLEAHDRVVVEEAARMHPVRADAADDGRGVDDAVGPRVGEAARDRAGLAQVDVLRARGEQRRGALAFQARDEMAPEEAAAAGDEDAASGPEAHGGPARGPAAASRAASARSASIISSTSASNPTAGFQPSSSDALARRRAGARPRSAGGTRGRPRRARGRSRRPRPSRRNRSPSRPVPAGAPEGQLAELPHRVALAGRDDVVARLGLLQHAPHRLDVVLRVAPVAPRVEVAEVEPLLQAVPDAPDRARDLARHEGLAAARRLVVEQDAVDGEEAVRLAVVDRHPVGVDLRGGVRAARVERRRLVLGHLLRAAEHLRGRRLVDPRPDLQLADRLEQAHGAEAGDLARVLRHVEGDLDVALRAEVVDLVRVDQAQRAVERGRVGQVPVVQDQPPAGGVRVLVDVVDPPGVEGRGAPDQAVDLVALVEQELGQVRPVLPGDPGDQRFLHDAAPSSRSRPVQRFHLNLRNAIHDMRTSRNPWLTSRTLDTPAVRRA